MDKAARRVLLGDLKAGDRFQYASQDVFLVAFLGELEIIVPVGRVPAVGTDGIVRWWLANEEVVPLPGLGRNKEP